MNSQKANILLIVIALILAIALIFGGDSGDLKTQYESLQAERDSLKDRIGVLELEDDSIQLADLGHTTQIDSAQTQDTIVIYRAQNRKDEYTEIYSYLDTIGRAERYRYLSTILTTFEPERY